jgi:hypothetical protein
MPLAGLDSQRATNVQSAVFTRMGGKWAYGTNHKPVILNAEAHFVLGKKLYIGCKNSIKKPFLTQRYHCPFRS